MSEGLQWILSALGSAVLNSIWQMGLLWLVVLLYSRFHHKLSPSKLSTVSFIALVAGGAAFIYTFFIFLLAPEIHISILSKLSNINIFHPVVTYAACAYIILLMVHVFRFSGGLQNVYRLRKNGLGKVPGHFKIFLLDLSQYLNIKRKVKIFTSALVQSPLTVGFLKPVILLPAAMISQLSVAQIEAVILHELAHIKRNDYLQNIISQIILTVLYFNPFAQMLANMQHIEREKSADKWVMQFEYNNKMYASTLLHLAQQNIIGYNNLAVQAFSKSSPLLDRVEWILGSGKRKLPSLRKLFALLSVALSAFALSIVTKLPTPKSPAAYTAPVMPVSSYRLVSVHEEASTAASDNNTQAEQRAEEPVAKNKTRPAKDFQKKNEEHAKQSLIVKAAPEQETVAAPQFAENVAVVLPELSAADEDNLQKAVLAAKKVITELSWKTIDNALAETVTADHKQALKDVYNKKMESAGWNKQADLLRLRYNSINWDEVNQKIATILDALKMDSIYYACHNLSQELSSYKKDLKKNSAVNKEKVKELNEKIRLYHIAIQQLDSLRSKKIVEL